MVRGGGQEVELHRLETLLFCFLYSMARLSSLALADFERKVSEEAKYVAELNRNAFGSRNWTAAHARLAEMQTLQLISGLAFGQMKQWQEQIADIEAAEYTVRESKCPDEFVRNLRMLEDYTQ